MTRLVNGTLLGLLPATLAALALGVPSAAPDVGLQNVALSCSDGTGLAATVDPMALAELSDAVSAINLFPAGDPALACGLSDPPPSSGDPNGPHDFAVGGGQYTPPFGICTELINFSLSAHAADDSPQQGVGGTFNLSAPATSPCPGTLTVKVDCVRVINNFADFTGQITHSTGIFSDKGFRAPLEFSGQAVDNPDALSGPSAGEFVPCTFLDNAVPITSGNITVHDA